MSRRGHTHPQPRRHGRAARPEEVARRCSRRPAGFTILEALVAVLIASSAIALVVPTFIRQLQAGSEASNLSQVEAVVSRDLDWISDYARWWRLRSGPYNITATIAQLPSGVAYTTSPEVVYLPPADRCAAGTLANGFQAALASVATNPARPYAIDATSTAAATLATLNGITVQRSLTPSGSTLRVAYSLAGEPAASLRFLRQASVLIEASAWCERLP